MCIVLVTDMDLIHACWPSFRNLHIGAKTRQNRPSRAPSSALRRLASLRRGYYGNRLAFIKIRNDPPSSNPVSYKWPRGEEWPAGRVTPALPPRHARLTSRLSPAGLSDPLRASRRPHAPPRKSSMFSSRLRLIDSAVVRGAAFTTQINS